MLSPSEIQRSIRRFNLRYKQRERTRVHYPVRAIVKRIEKMDSQRLDDYGFVNKYAINKSHYPVRVRVIALSLLVWMILGVVLWLLAGR